MKKILLTFIFLHSLSALAYFEISDVASFKKECLNNNKFTNPNYSISCGRYFHHYNSSARVRPSSRRSNIRISHFNSLHPGIGKTRFKDYELVAEMLSQFDIIAVTELIPSMSANERTNKRVANFAREIPPEIRRREALISKLKREQRSRHSVVREREIALEEKIVSNMKSDLNRLREVYQVPGYLKILNALRALNDGNNWALIISATPEGRETNETKELVGYYYRANVVSPVNTPYCSKRDQADSSKAYACHPLFDRRDMGENKDFIFSRRPFMASFKAGNFQTTLMAAHSIFDAPNWGSSWTERVLMAAFDKRNVYRLPVGLDSSNYARYAELKVMLEFINRRKGDLKRDPILLGDFNLESNNSYMDDVIRTWDGADIFIDKPTSASKSKYNSDGSKTNGVSSNYDHIILNPRTTSECMASSNTLDGGVYNFLNLPASKDLVAKRYKVRYESKFSRGRYAINSRKYEQLVRTYVEPIKNLSNPIYTIGRKKFIYKREHSKTAPAIVPNRSENREQTLYFKSRILESQKVNDTYYYFYQQIISDHLPIYVRCRI